MDCCEAVGVCRFPVRDCHVGEGSFRDDLFILGSELQLVRVWLLMQGKSFLLLKGLAFRDREKHPFLGFVALEQSGLLCQSGGGLSLSAARLTYVGEGVCLA